MAYYHQVIAAVLYAVVLSETHARPQGSGSGVSQGFQSLTNVPQEFAQQGAQATQQGFEAAQGVFQEGLNQGIQALTKVPQEFAQQGAQAAQQGFQAAQQGTQAAQQGVQAAQQGFQAAQQGAQAAQQGAQAAQQGAQAAQGVFQGGAKQGGNTVGSFPGAGGVPSLG